MVQTSVPYAGETISLMPKRITLLTKEIEWFAQRR
jgi:hypothetical protein